jgi:hypothetical protein
MNSLGIYKSNMSLEVNADKVEQKIFRAPINRNVNIRHRFYNGKCACT